MNYPYTKINRNQAYQFFDILRSFGYKYPYMDFKYFVRYCNENTFCIVIDDCGIFGSICFYPENALDPIIKRPFIEDPYEFLKMAAKYKNITEY